jgi:hypothetical protein
LSRLWFPSATPGLAVSVDKTPLDPHSTRCERAGLRQPVARSLEKVVVPQIAFLCEQNICRQTCRQSRGYPRKQLPQSIDIYRGRSANIKLIENPASNFVVFIKDGKVCKNFLAPRAP